MRRLLRFVGLFTVLVLLSSAASSMVSARQENMAGYPLLAARSIYVEPEALVSLARNARSPQDADLLVLSSDTRANRAEMINHLNEGVPLAFVGEDALGQLVAFLHGIDKTDLPGRVASLTKPMDVNYTFGFEYSPGDDYVAVAYPNGTKLDIHVYRTNAPSNQFALERLERTLKHHRENGSGGGFSTMSYSSTQNFTSIGTYHDEGAACPWGEWEIWIEGMKVVEENSTYDWVGWHVDQTITAGQVSIGACKSNNKENWRLRRYYDFDSTVYDIRDFGPESTQGTGTTTVGLSVGVSETGGSVGANWSWSYSISDVVVTLNYSPTLDNIEWFHSIGQGTNVAKSTYRGKPGVLVRSNNGRTTWNYSYEVYYRWYDSFWGTWSTHYMSGPGTWHTN